ncbi:MAG: response regulator [Acidobacteriota bacterium]
MANESILIIDDSPVNLKLARILLASEGYLIRTARDATEALSTLSTFRPHLILTDVQLPGIDGLELTRRIKANPDTPDITIVALTAYAMKGDEEKALSAGCDGYITKPFVVQELLLQVRKYLDTVHQRSSASPTASRRVLAAEDDPVESLQDIVQEFLSEGETQSRRLREEVKTGLNVAATKVLVHQWAGTGGTVGFPQISHVAFEIENLLEDSSSDIEELETHFRELVKLFSDALQSRQDVEPLRPE